MLRLGAVALVALIGGIALGAAVGWSIAAVGFLALVFVQLRYLDHLRRWLHAPNAEEIPEGWGAWGDVFGELYKAHRREERSRQRLAAALDRFVKASEALPDAVVILDAEHRIDWCNASTTRQFGIAVPRDRGQAIANLIRYPEFGNYLANGAPDTPVIVRTTGQPPQSPLVLSIQIIPFGEDEKLMLSRDITALERAETIRTDFIANVSHELRTPLTVVNGFLEHLTEGTLDPAASRRPLELMREQSIRMARLVEDLLTLSQLEVGHPVARVEDVNVPALVAALIDEGKALSRGRHALLAEVATAHLSGNVEELRAAFSNLLSNAIRYTPEGGRIVVRWESGFKSGSESGSDDAHFSVTDTGIGIAPEHIPRLTERFYRVDRGRSRETGGTGLGLAIVKHVLMRHDARIEITSTPGEGSTFTCIFPGARIIAQPLGKSVQAA